MQSINQESLRKRTSDHRDVRRLSRREFVKVTAIASAGLGLWLSGCAPGKEQSADSQDRLAVVDEWITALNAEDVRGFEKLHSESVFATTHAQRDPYAGREKVWDLYQASTRNQVEKIVAFGQDQSVCLLVNAAKINRSLCYVFNFLDGAIDRVYEYASGLYNLSTSPHFLDIEIAGDDSGLGDRLEAMDHEFVDVANDRDLSMIGEEFAESAIFFGVMSSEPTVGREDIAKGGEQYIRLNPSLVHRKIQTFGQGNLVCTHVAVDGAGLLGSLCWVGVFENGKIAELYEFSSNAKLAEQG